jgi:Spy/CpxP family protein refolding chaperone
MKIERILGGLVSVGMVAALSVPAVLAKSQAAPAQQGDMGMRDKLQSAVESLNLTDDQKKAKMKELHAGTMAKLNEVLTPEQQAQLKAKIEAAKAAKPPAQP